MRSLVEGDVSLPQRPQQTPLCPRLEKSLFAIHHLVCQDYRTLILPPLKWEKHNDNQMK
jgi:hypothetical protein